MKLKLGIFVCLMGLLSACWPSSISFSDTGSLHACLKKFQMSQLEMNASNAPINYATELTEAIKSGIQNRTRLLITADQSEAQVNIIGTVINYSVVPIALQEGDNAAKNRLTVSANFTIYFDCPTENYSQEMKLTSTRFSDFDATQDVSSMESQLLSEINTQIVQDVINKLLSNW